MTAARNLAPLLLAGWLAGCAAPLPAPREPLADADYHIFMGELALARGQNHVAVDEYRDAATRLADPAIARRGMMIAVHADDLAAARELVARWAELAPGDTELPRFRAMLALRAGESEEAYAHFLRMTAAPNPELVAANLQAVTGMLAGEENIWRAADLMARLAEARSQYAEAWHGAAMLALEADRPAAARQFATRALAIRPELEDLRFLQARAALLENPAATEAEKRRILAPFERYRHHSDNGLRYRFGGLLTLADFNEEADAVFADILLADPTQHDARMARALLAIDAGRLDDAETELHRLVINNARLQDALYYLGAVREASGDYEAAVQWYSRVAPEQQPQRWLLAQAAIARIILRQEGPEAAGAYFDELRKQWPEQAVLLTAHEASLLIAEGDPVFALTRIDDLAGRFDTAGRDLDWQIAVAAAESGRLEQAERSFRSLLERDPRHPMLQNALGYLFIEQPGREEEAEALLLDALQAAPANPAVLDSVGWLRAQQGRLEEARRLLEESWLRAPAPITGQHLLTTLYAIGDTASADALRQEVERKFPGLGLTTTDSR
ncbi:MAG TPA: tetratricopeptide repeat protein [Gammaproteobacteria bacterium]|nr:tetratricopeptide repeat protein [Gammaproteobacteria bacterium]